MASRVFDCLQVLGRRRAVINGSFQPNGASTTILGQKGNGFTVSHAAGTNLYTVQLQDAFFDYDSVTLDAQSPSFLSCQINGEPDVKVAKQIVIAVYGASGAASNDLAFAAQQRIHFQALLKNTSGNF